MKRLVLLAATVVLAAACTTGTGAGSTPASQPAPAATAAPVAPVAPTVTTTVAPSVEASPVAQIDVSVTWDGTTCAYAGPTDVPRGARMTFSLTNTPEALSGGREGAALIFFRIEDAITTADFAAWQESHPKGSDVPPWVDGTELVGPLYPDGGARGWTMSHIMTANKYGVICAQAPKDGEATHLGAIIETKDR